MEERNYQSTSEEGFNHSLRDRISSEEDFERIFERSASTIYHHAGHTLSLFSPGDSTFRISAYGENSESELEVLDSVEERFSLIREERRVKYAPVAK